MLIWYQSSQKLLPHSLFQYELIDSSVFAILQPLTRRFPRFDTWSPDLLRSVVSSVFFLSDSFRIDSSDRYYDSLVFLEDLVDLRSDGASDELGDESFVSAA